MSIHRRKLDQRESVYWLCVKMAEDGVCHKVVDNVDDCVKAVDDLLQEPVVAVDCEGINLGKKGPLTLLQVAKLDGFVYLFNVFVEPKVFTKGRLKSFLENRDIVKVFHGCSGDSAALKCQFDVMLINVFDVQMALFIIEKSEGRQLPYARKLMDVCSRYTDVTSLEGKEDVTAKLYKSNAAYWATKEFTPEMIDYACADVRTLIPEVYEKLKSILDDKDLWRGFRERVDYELNFRWNEAVKSNSDEFMSVVRKVLRQFESKYASDIAFADISDEDDIQALRLVRITEIDGFPVLVRRLKIEFLKNELKTIEEEMTSQGDSFIAT
ncbi:piRNA biogenesis protein EXD1-like [Haliotis rubra]|uniref:piRNA biogenesis protein EXD1-like n=1 Tax=Haliotis rubra TaxID=36100 RepID=UPI001EE55D4F|nr:piRNA biogenesis protein EXD1-like [Haliotis rubra]